VSKPESTPPTATDDGWGADSEEAAGPATKRSSLGALPGTALPSHGARPMLDGSGVTFRLLAPDHQAIDLMLIERDAQGKRKAPRRVRMSRQPDGFHAATVRGASEGTLYSYMIGEQGPFADPASRRQPFGAHGPSEVVNLGALAFNDSQWRGRPLEELVIYEVHVGTATREGTFRALIDRLDHIASLGATAIELMPIAEFSGERGWGYDGVCLFAPAHAYGTPADLAALVDAAHHKGLAMILDVVFNHLGPDGNALQTFWPGAFSKDHDTPWGNAFLFDGEGSEQIRELVIECATQWIRDYHFDGLRLDSTHAMHDSTSPHILTAIADCARAAASEREVLVFAEDDRNEARLVREVTRGGLGLDGVWTDDFHHAVGRIVRGDDRGFYADFRPELSELVKTLQKGWLYEGQPSRHLGKPRGSPCFDIAPPHLLIALQNHDGIGNRPKGDRLHHGVDLAWVRAATTLLLCAPFTPMLFMGQELAASTPFFYFTDLPADLGKQVGQARRAELEKLGAVDVPDPQDPKAFERSKIDWSEAERSPGRELLALHRALLALRSTEPAMRRRTRRDMDVERVGESLLLIRRRGSKNDPALLFVVGLTRGGEHTFGATEATTPGKGRRWSLLLDTESKEHGGDGDNVTLDGKKLVLKGPGAVVLKSLPSE
jgi:maltooligosyltrehalose trehalohydrolase